MANRQPVPLPDASLAVGHEDVPPLPSRRRRQDDDPDAQRGEAHRPEAHAHIPQQGADRDLEEAPQRRPRARGDPPRWEPGLGGPPRPDPQPQAVVGCVAGTAQTSASASGPATPASCRKLRSR